MGVRCFSYNHAFHCSLDISHLTIGEKKKKEKELEEERVSLLEKVSAELLSYYFIIYTLPPTPTL